MKGQMMVEEAPQEAAARLFMEHKGHGNVRPFDVDKLEDQPCWYFYYALPEGQLELEIFFDAKKMEWQSTVTSFVGR